MIHVFNDRLEDLEQNGNGGEAECLISCPPLDDEDGRVGLGRGVERGHTEAQEGSTRLPEGNGLGV